MVWVTAATVRSNTGNKYSGVPMGRPWNLGARSPPAFPPVSEPTCDMCISPKPSQHCQH